MTQAEKIKRLEAGLRDMAQYNPYGHARETAAAILDYSKPLVLSTPERSTGKVTDN